MMELYKHGSLIDTNHIFSSATHSCVCRLTHEFISEPIYTQQKQNARKFKLVHTICCAVAIAIYWQAAERTLDAQREK